MTFDEKKSILIDLIRLADADGDIDLNESFFISKIAQRLGVDDEALEEMYLSPNQPVQSLNSEFSRILQLQRLFMTMCVDGEIEKEELDYIRSVGLRLGLDLNTLNNLLTSLKRNPNQELPNIWESFKKHHN